MAIGSIDAIHLEGMNKVQQRISEIESKFGIGKLHGGDFQTMLEKTIQRSKAKSKSASAGKLDNTAQAAIAEAKKAAAKIGAVNKDTEIETFGGVNDKTNESVKKSIDTEKNKPATQSSGHYLPGSEALPDSINDSTSPFAASAARPIEQVEPEEIDVPTRDTKRESNYSTTSTEEMIEAAADKYNVDAGLVKAVAIAESNMNQNDISDAGAIGVMQLMPETARGLGVDPYDEQQNIEGGAKYLRQMLDTFGGNVKKAVAAYNAGPGAVKKYGGIPPYSETQHYVGRVMDLYR